MPGGISSTGLTAVPIPAGGLTGEVLVKLSNETGDYTWGVGGGGGSDVTGLSILGTVLNLTQSGGVSPITVDLATGGVVFNTRDLVAGAGLTGGGDLSADRTFNVVGNADGSIAVNANDIQVGVLATDAQHGSRGGGLLHAIFDNTQAGFTPISPGGSSDFLRADGTWATPPAFGSYMGTFDASVGTFPGPGVVQGDWYNTTVAGTVDGETFAVGDLLVALVNNPSTTTFTGNWTRIPNVSSADVTGPPSATDNAVARFDGTSGKQLQNGVVLIDDTGNITGSLSAVLGSASAINLTDVLVPLAVGDPDPATDQHLEFDSTGVQSKANATTAAGMEINRLGGSVDVGPQSGTGDVTLYRNGVIAADTGDSRFAVRSPSNGSPAVPNDIAMSLSFRSQDDNEYGFIDFGSGDPGDMSIINNASGGGMSAFVDGGTSLWFGNADEVALYDPSNDTVRLSTALSTAPDTIFGIAVQGELSNNPATGGDQDQVIEFRNSGVQRTALLGFLNEDTDLQLQNLVVGGLVELIAERTAGNAVTLVSGDPTGSVDLYNHITATPEDVARTLAGSAGGFEVRNLLTGAGYERVLTTSDLTGLGDVVGPASATDNAIARFDAATGKLIQNSVITIADTTGNMNGPDGWNIQNTGGELNLGGTDEVKLYSSGQANPVIQTTSSGAVILGNSANDPATGGIQTTLITLGNLNAAQVGQIGWGVGGSSADLRLQNRVHGGRVELWGEDAATGAEQQVFYGDPDNTVRLYYNGAIALGTENDGIILRGSLNNDPAAGGTQDCYIRLQTSGGTTAANLGFISNTVLRLNSNVHGGNVQLDGQNTAGAGRTMLVCDPDAAVTVSGVTQVVLETGAGGVPDTGVECNFGADVKLFFNNTENARTIIDTSGGFEVRNNLTGGGFERVLTTSDLSSGPIVQVVDEQITAVLSSVVSLPESSVLTSASGTLVDTIAITGVVAGNRVRVQLSLNVGTDNDNGPVVVLIVRGTTVLAVCQEPVGNKDYGSVVNMDIWDVPGAGSHTYTVRFASVGQTAYVNQTNGDATPYGGTLWAAASNISLTELTP